MSKNRLYQVLLSPRVTEKTTAVGEESNQYVFRVIKDANKSEVKGAVEMLFDVSVMSVRIVNVKGKRKSFRMRPGKRSDHGWTGTSAGGRLLACSICQASATRA